MKSPRCIASSGRTNRSLRRNVGNPEVVARGTPPSAEYKVDRLLSDVVVDPPVLAESRYRKSAREPRPPREMATRFPFVVEEWNATGGRALLRLLCPRHCVERL